MSTISTPGRVLTYGRRFSMQTLKSSPGYRVFPFFHCSEKMIFRKELHWNMIFLILSSKMTSLFPQNMIQFFKWKMKDDLSPKNTRKYGIFCKYSEKMGFPKKLYWNMVFLVLSEKITYFSQKYDLILQTENERQFFSKKYMKNMIFSVY